MPKRKRPHPKLKTSQHSKHAPFSVSPKNNVSVQKKHAANSNSTYNYTHQALPTTPHTIPNGSILLVGEGDFSFSRALLTYHLSQQARSTSTSTFTSAKHTSPDPTHEADNDNASATSSVSVCDPDLDSTPHKKHALPEIHATTLDPLPSSTSKHASAASNTAFLTSHGAKISYGIDARKLDNYACLRLGGRRRRRGRPREGGLSGGSGYSGGHGGMDGVQEGGHRRRDEERKGYDWIIFHFPHTGGLSTDMRRQVRSNQDLLSQFLTSAQLLLKPPSSTVSREGGKIVVTLFEGLPYSLWNIRDLARNAGLVVLRSERFEGEWWGERGYRHARTFGDVRGRERAERVEGEGDGGEEFGWEGFSETDGGEEEDEEVSGDEDENGNKRRLGRWRGEERPARSYIFGLKTAEGAAVGGTGKRRKRQDDSDDD